MVLCVILPGFAAAGANHFYSANFGVACMERKRVNSGTLRSVGYDQSSRTLEIEFTSGSIVQYANVPAEVHRRFLAAPTLASFFRDSIEEDYTARRIR